MACVTLGESLDTLPAPGSCLGDHRPTSPHNPCHHHWRLGAIWLASQDPGVRPFADAGRHPMPRRWGRGGLAVRGWQLECRRRRSGRAVGRAEWAAEAGGGGTRGGPRGALVLPRRPAGRPPARVGAEPRGRGWNPSQAGSGGGGPSRAPASSLSPRAPLPAASQLRAPGAGKKPHAPARNAGPGGRAGGGRRAGPGRPGSAPPRRLVRGGGGRARALPGPQRRPCARPVRRAGQIAASHTFPAGPVGGTTRELRGRGCPGDRGWWGEAGAGRFGRTRAARAPLPAAPLQHVPAGSEKGAGRHVSPHPSPLPAALGPRWGAGG